MVAAAAFILAVVSVAACDAQKDGEETLYAPFNLMVTESYDGDSIGVRPGSEFVVRLQGNSAARPPVTWFIASAPPVLRLRTASVQLRAPGRPEAGATWIFRFTVIAEGRGRLAFSGGESGRRVSFEIDSGDWIYD